MAILRQQMYLILAIINGFPLCVNGDTFYACRPVNYVAFPYYTITCQRNTVINVQSAIIGAAGTSGSYIAPSANNPDGECPWTALTNATCALVSPGCPDCQCTCVRSHPVPPDCNERECNFTKSNLIFPDSNPFCVVSRDADFIVVNYTCNSGQQVEKRMFAFTKPAAYITVPFATALACDNGYMSLLSTHCKVWQRHGKTVDTALSPGELKMAAVNSSSTSRSHSTRSPATTQSSSIVSATRPTTRNTTVTNAAGLSLSTSMTSMRPNKTVSSSHQPWTTQSITTDIDQPGTLDAGAIAGIVVGSVGFVAIVVLVVLLVVYCRRKEHSRAKSSTNDGTDVVDFQANKSSKSHDMTDSEHNSTGINYNETGKNQSTSPTVDLMTYEDATAFRAYDALPVGVNANSSSAKQPESESNGVTSKGRPDVYTAVVKKPAANGKVGYAVESPDTVHHESQQEQQQQQKQKKKEDKLKMVQMQTQPVESDIDRQEVVSLYPAVHGSTPHMEPVYVNSETAVNNSHVWVESAHNLTLIDSAVYGTGYQVADQGVGSQAAPGSDSIMSLTLIDNAMYTSSFNI